MREPDGGPVRPPRVEDITRHLDDLRTRTYEGAADRPGRERVFRAAVELLGPVVTAILEETDRVFLGDRGSVRFRPCAGDGEGGLVATWELGWPEQQAAVNKRADEPVGPVQVVAWLARQFNHGHLSGSRAGSWPLQVTGAEDAERQAPIVRVIVEAELHQRIFEAGWRVVPAYAGRYP